MRIAVLSDLHLEFYADHGRQLLARLDPSGVDVLVLAGDLCSSHLLSPTFAAVCARFAQVVYVFGNHEFYGSSFPDVRAEMRQVAARHANLHWLDHGVATIAGQRFVGTTLWHTPAVDDARFARYLTDFSAIEDFASIVEHENFRALTFLRKNVTAGDVVVTHHLPSPSCVTPKFADSPLNRFFVCDVERLIRERRPLLWVHGHTHAALDFAIGDTRILCNPLGYPGEDHSDAGRLGLVVEVAPRF